MLVRKERTASTNDDARALALEGAPEGTAVLAAQQTQGRGRAGRAWLSPEGGLYLSVVLRPRARPARWGLLPLALGAAAARVLRERGFEVDVKWPNDLLVGARKVGGILVETHLGDAPFAIAGIGLNVREAPAPEAVALAQLRAPPPVDALARALVEAFVARAARLDDVEALRDEARATLASLGREVAWEEGWGVAVDVDVDGALLVESGGRRHRVVAGDVRLRWS